jgi:hypothetical protein
LKQMDIARNWEDTAESRDKTSSDAASGAGPSRWLEAVKQEVLGPSGNKSLSQPAAESTSGFSSNPASSPAEQLFKQERAAREAFSKAQDAYLASFPSTWSQIREEAGKQPGRADLEKEYKDNLVKFHKDAASLPPEERERVTGLVPPLNKHHAFTPPTQEEIVKIRSELSSNPALLSSFNSMLAAGDKICANMSPREKELLSRVQEQAASVDRSFERYVSERDKNLTYDDVKKSSAQPGETRRAYSSDGDHIDIKYDDKGKPASITHYHGDLPGLEFKAADGRGFVSKDGRAFEGDSLINRSFRFADQPDKNTPAPRPTDRPSDRPADRPTDRPGPATLPDRSRPTNTDRQPAEPRLPVIERGLSRNSTQAGSQSGSDAKKSGVDIKAAATKVQPAEQSPAASTNSKVKQGQSSDRGALSEIQKKKETGVDGDNNRHFPRGYSNPSNDAAANAAREQRVPQFHFGGQLARLQHDQMHNSPLDLLHLNDRSQPGAIGQRLQGGIELNARGDRHNAGEIASAFASGTNPRISAADGQLYRRSGSLADSLSESKIRSLADLKSRNPFSLDLRDCQKTLSGRKDLIDKLGGPIQGAIGKGGCLIFIGAARILDGKGNAGTGKGSGARGDRGAGGKTPDAKGEKGLAGSKAAEASRVSRLEDMRARTLRLPAEVINQGARIAERLIRNPRELFEGKNSALADALRQLSKTELNAVRLILRSGMNPDFSRFNEKLQAQLIVIFKTLLEQGNAQKGGKEKVSATSDRSADKSPVKSADKVAESKSARAAGQPGQTRLLSFENGQVVRTADTHTVVASGMSAERNPQAQNCPRSGLPIAVADAPAHTQTVALEQNIANPAEILAQAFEHKTETVDLRVTEPAVHEKGKYSSGRSCHVVKPGETLKSIAVKYFGDDAGAPVILHINRQNRQIDYQSHKGRLYVVLPADAVLTIPSQDDIDAFKKANVSYAHLDFGSMLDCETIAAVGKALDEVARVGENCLPASKHGTAGNNWGPVSELLGPGLKIRESQCLRSGEQGIRVSLQLQHQKQWLILSQYEIFSTGSNKLQYKQSGSTKQATMNLAPVQLKAMARNDFRNNWRSIFAEYWRAARG